MRVPADERVLYRARPHGLFVVLSRLESLVGVSIAAALGYALTALGAWGAPGALPVAMGVFAAGAVLMVGVLDWMSRSYTLTPRRVLRGSGIVRRAWVDLPLERVQSVAVVQSLRERIFGLGSLVISTAGGTGGETVFTMIADPAGVSDTLREQADAARARAPGGAP